MPSISFSFDTVTVVIPTTDPDLSSKLVWARSGDSFDATCKPTWGWTRHYLWTPDLIDQLPSHWSPPQVGVEGSNIILQFSLPKLLYGHSARHAADLGPVLQAWETTLASLLDITVAQPWPEWRLRRVDLSYNFQMESPDQAENAYLQLSRLRCRGRLGITKGRDKLAYWPSATRTVKFYLKGAEMKKHSRDYPEQWVEKRQFALDCVLRYEEEWRGKKLSQFCRVDTMGQVTVGQFLARVDTWSVEEHFDSIQKLFTVRALGVSLADCWAILDKFRKPKPYREFIHLVADQGLEFARKSLSTAKFYRICAKLRSVGIEPQMIESQYDSAWALQADLTQFISLENLATAFDHEEIPGDFLTGRVRGAYHNFFNWGETQALA